MVRARVLRLVVPVSPQRPTVRSSYGRGSNPRLPLHLASPRRSPRRAVVLPDHVDRGRDRVAARLPDGRARTPSWGSSASRVRPHRDGEPSRSRRAEVTILVETSRHRRPRRRFRDRGRRRHRADPEPKRLPAQDLDAINASARRRALPAVLGRDLVPDRLRGPADANRSRAGQTPVAVRSRRCATSRPSAPARRPVGRTAVLPRPRAGLVERRRRRRQQHLPRRNGVPPRAERQGAHRRGAGRAGHGDRDRGGSGEGRPAPRRQSAQSAVRRQTR